MHRKRVILGVAVAATAATVLAACSSSGSSSTSANSSSAKVTLTWWNNANTQPLLGVFNNIIKQFETAHPNITISNVPMQNELFKTKITPALRGNAPPDIYQGVITRLPAPWGGGTRDTMPIDLSLFNVDSDAAYQEPLGPGAIAHPRPQESDDIDPQARAQQRLQNLQQMHDELEQRAQQQQNNPQERLDRKGCADQRKCRR